MRLNNSLKFLIAVAVCELAGALGSAFTVPAIGSWYAGLAKPALSPPNWIFGPVWTALYLLMGTAAFLVWKRGTKRKGVKNALGVFISQLALNAVWSVIFFGLKNPLAAFVELAVLWFAIIWTAIAFYKISRPAAWLLLPYILWVSFAGYLNFSIWFLNR